MDELQLPFLKQIWVKIQQWSQFFFQLASLPAFFKLFIVYGSKGILDKNQQSQNLFGSTVFSLTQQWKQEILRGAS